MAGDRLDLVPISRIVGMERWRALRHARVSRRRRSRTARSRRPAPHIPARFAAKEAAQGARYRTPVGSEWRRARGEARARAGRPSCDARPVWDRPLARRGPHAAGVEHDATTPSRKRCSCQATTPPRLVTAAARAVGVASPPSSSSGCLAQITVEPRCPRRGPARRGGRDTGSGRLVIAALNGVSNPDNGRRRPPSWRTHRLRVVIADAQSRGPPRTTNDACRGAARAADSTRRHGDARTISAAASR